MHGQLHMDMEIIDPTFYIDGEKIPPVNGAAIFTQSLDGSEVYAVCHAKLHANNRYNRCIFLQKLEYQNGVPYLGAPPSLDTVFTVAVNPMAVSERDQRLSDKPERRISKIRGSAPHPAHFW